MNRMSWNCKMMMNRAGMKFGKRLFQKTFGASFSLLLAAILCLSTMVCFASPVSASSNLDEIQVYNITVDMRPDGTMDLVYHLEWKVLDDSSEGPLEWVKIGIPNMYSDSYTALSDNISSIDYFYDNGDFVRIDFDRSYYKDEIVSFDFSFHQTRMYTLDEEQNLCVFDFIPGWFNDIDVKSFRIRWNSSDVLSSDATGIDPSDSATLSAPAGSYLTWSGSLAAGDHVYTHIEYSLTTFETNSDMQYVKQDTTSWDGQIDESQPDAPFALIPIFLFGIFAVFSIFANTKNGKYRGGFGSHFIGRGGGGIGGGGCACASSCACACACACAGGGRAGCSAKNFYGASIRSELLKDELTKDHI